MAAKLTPLELECFNVKEHAIPRLRSLQGFLMNTLNSTESTYSESRKAIAVVQAIDNFIFEFSVLEK